MTAMGHRWNYEDLQDAEDKTVMLRFLPYLDTRDVIGYEPAWVRRGYGYGRWEEFFHTLAAARERMDFLIDAAAIEDAEIYKAAARGRGQTLVDAWREGDRR